MSSAPARLSRVASVTSSPAFYEQPPLRLIAISGSLRAASFNAAIARAATSLAPPNSSCEVVELVGELPVYNEDLDTDEASNRTAPGAVTAMRQRIAAASGVLFVTPEYNYGPPGGLKNLIDWASRPFGAHCLVGRAVAVIGSSPSSRGGLAAVEYLRQILPAIGARLVGEVALVPRVGDHVQVETAAVSDWLGELVTATLAELAVAARLAPEPTAAP